jgi:hypothetical protein
MIFVDTIDKCISISTYLRNGLTSSMAEYRRMVFRPFHASLEVSLREEYLNTFRDGETRVPVCIGTYLITRDNSNMGTKELCIDAAGMGVDIPDIEVVMQWKISPHLTIATLWQRIGRAGRDPKVKAISVLFVDQKQILPKEIPEGSEWVDFDLAVSEQTAERIRELIKRMYVRVENGNLIATAMPYHCVEPPILWYVNTTGCRCRRVMAIFLDYKAFSHQPRVEGCCDNIVFSLGQESEFVRSGIDMRASIRYLETRDGLAQEAAKHILAEQRNAEKRAVKTSTAQHFEVRSALDIWTKSTFGSQHRVYFSPSLRAKLAGDARRLDTRDAIVTELDGRDFCFQESRLWTHAEAILTVMREAPTTEDDDVE